MTTIEQSKRLKEAGFPQGKTIDLWWLYRQEGKQEQWFPTERTPEMIAADSNMLIDAPSEKEMLFWLTGKIPNVKLAFSDEEKVWQVLSDDTMMSYVESSNSNITEALVSACLEILKAMEKNEQYRKIEESKLSS